MKNNIENIPVDIFECLTHLSFQQLTHEQQQQVLSQMSQEEYDELYRSHSLISESLNTHKRSLHTKEALLQMFDEQYPQQAKKAKFSTAVYWQAACVLLSMATIFLALQNRQWSSAEETETLTLHDTIFIQQALPAQSSVDSGIASSQEKHKVHTNPKRMDADRRFAKNPAPELNYAKAPALEENVQVLSINTLHDVSNNSKRNSMHDDSLERNFKFVSM